MPSRFLRSSRRPRRCAHTVWEMLVVLLLLGTIAALVGPAMGSLRRPRDDGVSRVSEEVVSLLAQARATALRKGDAVDVVVDPATSRAWLFGRGEGGTSLLAATVLPSGAEIAPLPAAPRARFTFHPGGSASGPAIVVREGAIARLVTVDPWSGEIRADRR